MSLVDVARFSDEELAELNQEFERLPASKIIQWAVDQFAPHLSLSASMNDAVLIDLATKVHPGIEVVFIDTGYHFPETLQTVEAVRRRYGLNLRLMTVPHHDEELWRIDPENCCSAVKVGQLDRALEGKAAWMSGLRREEAATRGQAPLVARDLRGLVKVNPLATWTSTPAGASLAPVEPNSRGPLRRPHPAQHPEHRRPPRSAERRRPAGLGP